MFWVGLGWLEVVAIVDTGQEILNEILTFIKALDSIPQQRIFNLKIPVEPTLIIHGLKLNFSTTELILS